MLKIITNCENCNCPLANESEEAMICSFECTFCQDCVQNILKNVCPNCTGGFEKRPTRPQKMLAKYPIAGEGIYKPINPNTQAILLEKHHHISSNKR